MFNTIKTLRDRRGYSQEELATELGITRQTLIKYENGEQPTLENVKKIANFFEVSYDCIIDNTEPVQHTYNIIPDSKNTDEPSDIRIDIPQNNIEKFKQVLLYILKKVGGKPNVGQTVLYKLLYFIDFDYYELHEEQLMGLKYIKNTYGPTPVDFKKLIIEMEKNGELTEAKTKFFTKDMTKYLPIKEPDMSLLSAQELTHIDKELEKYSDKTAKELSELSHKDVPWIGTKDKEIIPYEAVFYRNDETSVRGYND